MENYRTEEEQVEALKKWWEENGRSTLTAIAIALALGFGWQGWQKHQKQSAMDASARYDQMLEAVRESAASEDFTTLRTLAEAMKTDHPNTTYAQFAALHLARIDVVSGDLEAAEAQLRWVLTQNPAMEIEQLTQVRLARVIAARGDPAAALDIVAGAEAGAYAPAYAEAEGDFHHQLGDTAAAVEAYERAVSLAAATRSGASETLRLKLSTLSPVPAREIAALEE